MRSPVLHRPFAGHTTILWALSKFRFERKFSKIIEGSQELQPIALLVASPVALDSLEDAFHMTENSQPP